MDARLYDPADLVTYHRKHSGSSTSSPLDRLNTVTFHSIDSLLIHFPNSFVLQSKAVSISRPVLTTNPGVCTAVALPSTFHQWRWATNLFVDRFASAASSMQVDVRWLHLGAALASFNRSWHALTNRVTNLGLHNLCKEYVPDADVAKVLGLGLKYIVKPRNRNTVDHYMVEFDRFVRRIRLRALFGENDNETPRLPLRYSVPHPEYQPPPLDTGLESALEEARREFVQFATDAVATHGSSRVTTLRRTLYNLRHTEGIVVKPADKNLGVVLLDGEEYSEKVFELLGDLTNFEPIPLFTVESHANNYLLGPGVAPAAVPPLGIVHTCNGENVARQLHLKAYAECFDIVVKHRCITPNRSWRSALPDDMDEVRDWWGNPHRPISLPDQVPVGVVMFRAWGMAQKGIAAPFYGLPKIHKSPWKLRPITPAHSLPSSPICSWIVDELRPVLDECPFVLRDSRTLIKLLESTAMPSGHSAMLLVTMDVESLYPSIPRERMVTRMRATFRRLLPEYHYAYLELLLDLVEWTHRHHIVSFAGRMYRQIQGTAMGIAIGPLVANAFMADVEYGVFDQASQLRCEPLLYKRYIDDIFAVFTGASHNECVAKYHAFRRLLEEAEHALRYTSLESFSSVPFLDMTVHARAGRLEVSAYIKALNLHQYVPFSSCHRREQLAAPIKAELMRFVVTNTRFDDYMARRQLFYEHLRARGYPRYFLVDEFVKVTFSRRKEYLYREKSSSEQSDRRGDPYVFIVRADDLVVERLVDVRQWLTLARFPPELLQRTVICHSNSQSTGRFLVRATAH